MADGASNWDRAVEGIKHPAMAYALEPGKHYILRFNPNYTDGYDMARLMDWVREHGIHLSPVAVFSDKPETFQIVPAPEAQV